MDNTLNNAKQIIANAGLTRTDSEGVVEWNKLVYAFARRAATRLGPNTGDVEIVVCSVLNRNVGKAAARAALTEATARVAALLGESYKSTGKVCQDGFWHMNRFNLQAWNCSVVVA